MKKIIMSATDANSKIYRNFANEVCDNLLESCGLEAQFRLDDGIIMFTIFRDKNKSSVHTTYDVPYYKVREAQGSWEYLSDLIDDTVNKIAHKVSKAL